MGFGGDTDHSPAWKMRLLNQTRLNSQNKLPERLQGGEDKLPLNCLHRPEETETVL